MKLKISAFEVPEGLEESFGKDPRAISAVYDSDIDDKEVAVLEYEFFVETGGEKVSLNEFGMRVISEPGEIELDFVQDADDIAPNSKIVLRYRLFTLESTAGPSVAASEFEIKVPAKGKAELPVNAPHQGTLELQPGGYAKATFSLSSDAEGDWCLVARITDQDGDSQSSAEIAENGSATLSVGMAGKPKTLAGFVSALGANQWCEIKAALA